MHRLRLTLAYGAPGFYVFALFWFGSLPAQPSGPHVSDKLLHFVAFAGLCVISLPAVSLQLSSPRCVEGSRVWLFSAAFSSLVGGALEVWQSFFPHRDASWGDFVADAAGAFLVALGGLLLQRSRGGSS